MRRSPLVFIIAALFLGIVVAGGFYYHYRQSPRFALQQMMNSLMQRNYKEFYTYLELKSILNHLMQETGKDLVSPLLPPGDYLSQLGLRMGSKLTQNLLPRVIETFEKDLHSLTNKYLDTLTTENLQALEAAVNTAGIKWQGEEALVTLKFPKRNGQLLLTMSRNFPNRSWRVVSVNYEDLKQALKKELF